MKLILKILGNNFSKICQKDFSKSSEIFWYNFRNFSTQYSKFSKIFPEILWSNSRNSFTFTAVGILHFGLVYFLEHPNPFKKFSPATNFLFIYMTEKIFYSSKIFILLFRINFLEILCFLVRLIFEIERERVYLCSKFISNYVKVNLTNIFINFCEYSSNFLFYFSRFYN